jgi:predicted glycosyl hydrolase (DUF1957 family)
MKLKEKNLKVVETAAEGEMAEDQETAADLETEVMDLEMDQAMDPVVALVEMMEQELLMQEMQEHQQEIQQELEDQEIVLVQKEQDQVQEEKKGQVE